MTEKLSSSDGNGDFLSRYPMAVRIMSQQVIGANGRETMSEYVCDAITAERERCRRHIAAFRAVIMDSELLGDLETDIATGRAASSAGILDRSPIGSGFISRLVENVFSWALQQCNYLDPKYAERLVAETIAGMKPEQAAVWRADGPEIAAGKAKPSIRNVGAKMMRLNEHDQRKVIEALGLEETGDDDILDWQAALAAVKRAAEIGTLEHLEKAIDAKLGSNA